VIVTRKKIQHKTTLLLATLFFVSCSDEKPPDDNYLAEVNFFNESSYSVSVNQASFSGSILIDMLASGENQTVKIPPSDNYGIGSMFSIVYHWPMEAKLGPEFADNYISAIDPNMQISQNIEAGESYSISIPNPGQLEFTEKFLKISNASDNSFQLGYLSRVFIQVGNGEISVPKGKTGVYKIDGDLEHAITQKINIVQGFESCPIPEFTAEKGRIYDFEFDGKEVKEIGSQKIGFDW